MRATTSIILALTLAAPALAQQNPLGGPPKQGGEQENPLAKRPPWVGTYTDGSVSLTLATSAEGFSGELTVGQQDFPVRGTHTDGTAFEGQFTVDGVAFAFTATRTGAKLTLVSDGHTYELTREGAPANPLGGGGAAPKPSPSPGGGNPAAGLAELGDVDAAPVTPFKQAQGWLTFGIPQGWRIQGEDAETRTIVFDPGYQQGGVLEAVVLARYGDLEPQQVGQPVSALLREAGPELQQELAMEMGIQISGGNAPVDLRLNNQPAGFVEWPAIQQQDNSGVTVWVGGVAHGPRFFMVVGIVQKGRESKYLPKARRILATALVNVPKPGEQPTVSLAGREVFHESVSESGSVSTTYEFAQGGQVKKTTYFSAAGLGGEGASSESNGSYALNGNRVQLNFQDGVEQATLVLEGGQLTGLQIGNVVYRLRR